MGEFVEKLRTLIVKGDVRTSDHGYDELADARFSVRKKTAPDDVTDRSVTLAMSFLGAIGAEKIKRRVGLFIDRMSVLIADGPAIADGAVTVDSRADIAGRAWSMIEQALSVSGRLTGAEIDGFRTAFEAYIADTAAFDIDRSAPELRLAVLSLEGGMDGASNEGGIDFLPKPFKGMLDVSGITLADCEKEGVIADIKGVFDHVARHDMEQYNDAHGDTPIAFREMPGTGNKLVVERLSDGLLPTAVSRYDGTIALNENFVKLMCLFTRVGMRDRGDIYGIPNRDERYQDDPRRYFKPLIGNMYQSILYSTAIHEIRGHFKIERGAPVLNTDEEFAQGERGGKKLYVNIIAIVYFWLEFVEVQGKTASFDSIADFMVAHPALYRGLEKGQHFYASRIISDASMDLGHMKVSVDFRNWMDIPERDVSIPAVNDEGRIFNLLYSTRVPMTAEEIAAGPGMDGTGNVKNAAGNLVRLGMAREVRKDAKGVQLLKPSYRAMLFTIIQEDDMRRLLLSLGVSPDSDALDAARKTALKIMRGEPVVIPPPTIEVPAEYVEVVDEDDAAAGATDAPLETAGSAHPAWRNIATLYAYIAGKTEWVDAIGAAGDFRVDDPARLTPLFEMLAEAGLVTKHTKKKGGKPLAEPAYTAMRLPGAQRSAAADALAGISTPPADTDMAALRGLVVNITDPVWAGAFMDSVKRNAATTAGEGRRTIIAVDTSWMPAMQEGLVFPLVQALSDIGGKTPFTVVHGAGADLAAKINSACEKEGAPLGNVVVLAAKETIRKKEFAAIRAKDDNDKDKAFVVGVDPGALSDTSYIRLLEMLTLAVRLSFGLKPLSWHPEITVGRVNSRLYIFIPKPSPVDFESVKRIYTTQRKTLTTMTISESSKSRR